MRHKKEFSVTLKTGKKITADVSVSLVREPSTLSTDSFIMAEDIYIEDRTDIDDDGVTLSIEEQEEAKELLIDQAYFEDWEREYYESA